MKSDDLVFVNQQLASYLSSGIPLEAALRDAAGSLKPGQFRKNLTRLADRLESGQPFDKSIQALDFPDIYKKILICGAESENIPQALISAIGFYQSQSTTIRQLKLAVMYPLVILAILLVVSLLVGWTVTNTMATLALDGVYRFGDEQFLYHNGNLETSFLDKFLWIMEASPTNTLLIWLTPMVLLVAFIFAILAAVIKPLRDRLMWWLPGFREGNVSLASSLLVSMHRSGVDWSTSLDTISNIYKTTSVGMEFRMYYRQIAEGRGGSAEILNVRGPMPGLFRWIIACGGEDLPGSLDELSLVYRDRSRYFHDLLLNFITPAAILTAALFIVGQSLPILNFLNSNFVKLGG